MEYVLSKKQFEEYSENIKQLVFKFWDVQRKIDMKMTMSFFRIPFSFSNVLDEWAVEWYGGVDKIMKILENFINKKMRATSGTYDFDFFIHNPKIYDDLEISFDTVIDGDGDVYIVNDDETILDNIRDATEDNNISWEVFDELRDVIYEVIKETTGLPFRMFVDNVDITEQGNF